MLRITKESEYAFLLLSELLARNNIPQSATVLAKATGIAAPVTGKILKRLVKSNILTSIRGVRGGYILSRSPVEISALNVVEAIEGVLELVDCVHGETDCVLMARCNISPFWQNVNKEITGMLAQKSLADMQRDDGHLRSTNAIESPIADMRGFYEQKRRT